MSIEEENNSNSELDILKIQADRILSKPSITVDYELYAHHLERADLSAEQKREYAQAIWSVMFHFASLGYDLHPLQQVDGVCGQFERKSKIPISDLNDLVDSP